MKRPILEEFGRFRKGSDTEHGHIRNRTGIKVQSFPDLSLHSENLGYFFGRRVQDHSNSVPCQGGLLKEVVGDKLNSVLCQPKAYDRNLVR